MMNQNTHGRMDDLTSLACERFDSILQEHTVTKWAIHSLALSDAIALAALVRVGSGMRRASDSASISAEEWIEKAEEIASKEGFHQIRVNLLVALCGALEYAVKAFFVDGVINRPGSQRDWALISNELKSRPTQCLEIEWIFSAADDLFCERSAKRLPMARRMVEFINAKCSVPPNRTFSLVGVDCEILTEAYSTRNTLLHRGGYERRKLLTMKDSLSAGPISLNVKMLHRYVESMSGFSLSLKEASEQITMSDL
jgi:hypothetical protein